MRKKRFGRSVLSILLILAMVLPVVGLTAAADTSYTADVTITFNSGSEATATDSNNHGGYSISGEVVTISAAGTYKLSGTASDGSVQVNKNLSGVVLLLDGLSITGTAAGNAPIVIGKSTSATIYTSSSSTLTDSESDTTSEDYEGAAIKVKSGASLTIQGSDSATLTVNGSSKNGIKGAATSTVTVESGKLTITAAKHGLAADGEVVISGGTLNIVAKDGGEGIKSEPDDDDTESAGTVTITGGTISINTYSSSTSAVPSSASYKGGDGIQAANDISISGQPSITIYSYNDGIQSNGNLTIANGTFNITTYGGSSYNSAATSANISAKGIKASSSDTDTDDATNTLTITGGTFTLNTADDAVHSDGYATITGGTLNIQTGDDGVHADTGLILGTENGYARDPEINITKSYEGLESGTIYMYSGKYWVVASDDGVNAAGGSSNGTDPGGPGGNGGSGSSGNSGSGSGSSGSGSGSSGGTSTTVVNTTTGEAAENAEDTAEETAEGEAEDAVSENAKAAAEQFTDVSETAWYADAVGYAVEQGYFKGTSESSFSPSGNATREQVMTVLARYAGEADATIEEGVAWAVKNGISDGTMRLDSITREQFVTMLYRLIVGGDADGVERSRQAFTDSDQISSWAAEAMSWALDKGVLTGYTDNTLRPADMLTRAQMAVIMQRIDEKGIRKA